MSQDVSGFGTLIRLTADKTYPAGVAITDFSDDADPITIAGLKIADSAMTLNGTLAKWQKAVPIPVTINVLPGSPNDQALTILGNVNRIGAGKVSAGDTITLLVAYPDGQIIRLTGGILTDYDPGRSISSAGRQKTKSYSFMFENLA